MRLHGRVIRHSWLLAVVAVLLIAAHGFLYEALSKMTLPAVVASGIVLLIAMKVLGLLALLFTRFRGQRRGAD